MRILRSPFVGAAVLWAVVLPLAPFAASRPHAVVPWYAFALATYAVGSVICHQLPERSFHLWAAQMPVCARCTGIYFGAAIAAIASVTVRLKADTMHKAKIALTIAAIPMLATLVFEWTTGHTPANWIRAAAGVPIGGAIAWVISRGTCEKVSKVIKVN